MHTISEALAIAQQALTRGDLARAKFIYEQIIAAAPTEPTSLAGLGALAYQVSDWPAAEHYFRRAVDAHGVDPLLHNNLALVYQRQGRAAEAVASGQAALRLAPSMPELHNNLGTALKMAAALEDAVASYQRAIALRPDYADAYYNLANTLLQLDRLDAAEAAYRRALELAPNDWQGHNNLGSLLQRRGNFAQAMAGFDTALSYQSDAAEAHRNRALLHLLLGNFSAGWGEYEWRWKMPDARFTNHPQPRWQGQPLPGKTLVLSAEQGLGDTLQFIRYAALVKPIAGRVMVEAPAKLHALLRAAPGVDEVVCGVEAANSADFQIPLLSLPAVLGTTLESMPVEVPYLFAEPSRVEHWRQKLAATNELKVGIAWQGNPDYPGDRFRSMSLGCFEPLAHCPGVKLFSLQKGFGSEQLASQASWGIVELGPELDQGPDAFVDTAAVMRGLDLVVTSDTAIAHLAGALGVKVWVALQQTPNWRWLLERENSPWYPTMRLFRQRRDRDWSEVFARIGQQLNALTVGRSRT